MAWRRRIRRCGMRPRQLERRRGRRSARGEQKRRNGRVGRRRGRRLVERSRERERSEVRVSILSSCLCPSDSLTVLSFRYCAAVPGRVRAYRRYLTTYSYPIPLPAAAFIQSTGIVCARARTRTRTALPADQPRCASIRRLGFEPRATSYYCPYPISEMLHPRPGKNSQP
jgi:hypothetical protein